VGARRRQFSRFNKLLKKGSCWIKNGKWEKALQFSWSEVYEKARGEARKGKKEVT
jgi:hypothetical protein